MATLIVDTPALNFRSEPVVASETLIGTVYLGQRVTRARPADEEGWYQCNAVIEGEEVSGFVSGKFLRERLSKNRERLVASVHDQWMRFKRGAGKEHHHPYADYVGEMWQAIGIHLDGTDRDQPWSAAAISFFVRKSGSKYRKFKFAAAHSKFVHHAINARFDKDDSVPFWGYRLDEIRPEIGDIICRDNPSYAPEVDFEIARHQNAYRSHTDVIMHIDRDAGKIYAIGGNVSHSVKIAMYDLTHGNYAADTRHTFALLKNITDGTPD